MWLTFGDFLLYFAVLIHELLLQGLKHSGIDKVTKLINTIMNIKNFNCSEQIQCTFSS